MSISFVAILVIACGMALLAKRLKVPYTVLLVVAGLAMSLLLDGAPGLRERVQGTRCAVVACARALSLTPLAPR